MSEAFFQILSRVHSFKVGSWPYIDIKQLCPYRLASMGYFVSSPFVLQCSVCHHTVQVPQQFEAEYHRTIEQVSKHNQNCIYFASEDSDEFNHQTTITKEQIYLLIDEITIQTKEGHNILVQNKTYPALNKEQIHKYLSEDNFTFRFIQQSYKLNWSTQIKITFFMQFFGWSVKRQEQNADKVCAQCVLCGRNVGLDKLKMLDKDQQLQSLDIAQEQCFNPVSEHRYFCLWVNPKCSGYKGYSIYIQHLYDKINESKSLFSRRAPNETKKIRVQLDKYLESFQQKTSEQFQKIKTIFKECGQARNLIVEQIQKDQRSFSEGQRKMKEFVNEIGDEFRQQIKKIKLT